MTDAPARRPDFFERRYAGLLLGLLALSAAFRVASHLDLAASDPTLLIPQLDSEIYLQWAGRIAAGDLFGSRTFFLNPLYPYLLAPLVHWYGDGAASAAILIQGVLGLGTVWLLASATRRFAGAGTALLAGLLAGTWPLLLYFEEKVMIVALAVFLNALSLWLLGRFEERRSPAAAALAGAAIGLGIAARPNVGLFLVLLLPWMAILATAGNRLRFVLTRGGALFLGAAAVVLPFTVRNVLVAGDFVLTTTGFGANFWQSNNPASWETGLMASPELRGHPVCMENDAEVTAEQATGRRLRAPEVSSYWTRRTVRVILEHPGAALLHFLRKGFWFFRDVEIPSSYHIEAEKKLTSFLRWIPLDFGLISPLAAAGAFLALRRRRAAPAAILFVTYFAATVLIYPYAHHRAAALPALFPLAALATASLAGLWRSRRRRFALAAAALAVALLATHATTLARAFGIRALSADAFYRKHDEIFGLNRGITLLELGHPDRAEEVLRETLGEHPDSALICAGLAEVAKARGELANELHWLRESVARAPEEANTLSRLAQAELAAGNLPAARAWAEKAIATPQADPFAFVTLGRMEIRRGAFAEALALFETAGDRGIGAPELMAEQSACLRGLGRAREALDRVRSGLLRAPDSAPLLFEMVEALLAQSPPDEEGARRTAQAAAAAAARAGFTLPPSVRRLLR